MKIFFAWLLFTVSAFAQSPPSSLVTPSPPANEFAYTNSSGVQTYGAYIPRTAWTPSISATTPGDLVANCSTATGYYSRIGSRVFVDFTLTCAPTYTTASGNFRVTGLPYNPYNSGITYAIPVTNPITSFVWNGAAYSMIEFQTFVGTSVLQLFGFKSGNTSAGITIGQFPTGATLTISGSGSYDTLATQ